MFEAPPADDVQLRVLAHGSLDQACHNGTVKLDQVIACQMRDQVRRRVDRPPVDPIHSPEP